MTTLSDLTENQRAALHKLVDGPSAIASIHASRLMRAGYVEKTNEGSGARGYSHVRLTPVGEAAVAP